MSWTESRLRSQWDQTAFLATIIYNSQCVKKSDRIKDPSILNPLRKTEGRGRQKVTFAEAKQILSGRN